MIYTKSYVIFLLVVFACSYSSHGYDEVKGFDDYSAVLSKVASKIDDFGARTSSEIEEFIQTSEECDCGNFSTKCEMKDGNKICTCKDGYAAGINETCIACLCGENSVKCERKDGLKICSCIEGYVPGINENCTEMCNDTRKCLNGGTCFKGICRCPPRTRGTFCEEINVLCWNFGYEDQATHRGLHCCCRNQKKSTAECRYDTKKYDAYCKCPKEDEVYDDSSNACTECNCGKKGTWTKCDFYGGVKTCFCSKNYEYNNATKICEPCNCGENSEKCEFAGNGNIKCNCETGYQQWKNSCQQCDCGSYGFCELREGKPICHCDEGSQEFEGTCKKCDCGQFGICVFDNSGKKLKCECDTGYAEKAGKCEYCYCGDNAVCSFDTMGNKSCECPSGFLNITGFCSDIDECANTDPCPPTEKCINLPGTYICGCADGYYHTGTGCSDFNECEIKDSCSSVNSECVNTPGSFECRCKSGYLTRGGSKSSLLCQNNSAAKIGYGILGTLFALIVIGLLAVLYQKYRNG